MSAVELTEAFLAKIAGWEAMKHARALLEQRHVLSSNWTPPILKGVVQEGTISYRAGLVLKDSIDLENMCSCRASRQWGTICAHSVAVGLHHLNGAKAAVVASASTVARPGQTPGGSTAASQTARSAPALGKQIKRAESATAGEPVEIFIIFPPNLIEAVAKGKVMLCFEAKWSRGRCPLNALPLTTPFKFSEQDLALLDKIEPLARSENPAMLMLSTPDFAEILHALINHPRVTLGKLQPLSIASEPWRPVVETVLREAGEIQLRLAVTGSPPVLISERTAWVLEERCFHPIGLPEPYLKLFKEPILLSRSQVPQFLSQDWATLKKSCELRSSFAPEDFILEPRSPRFLLSLYGGLAQLQALLQCRYGARIMTVGVTDKDESFWLPDPDSPTRYSTRDLAAEQAALGRLLRHGFRGPDPQGRLQLVGQSSVLNFLAREYPRLEKEWEVSLEERLERSTVQNLERIEPKFQVTPSGEQWFDLDVSFASETGERFSAAEIQRLILSGQSHTRLKNGRFALIDIGAVEELQEVLLDCAPQQLEDKYRLKNAQAGYLESTVRHQTGWELQAPDAWREQLARQTGAVKLEPPPLGDLDSVLRPYQKHGVAWLHFLRQHQLGGILADEMGLGKTLQTLAFLKSLIESQKPQDRRPSLVVCPTSLVFNWVAEANRFTPQLRVLALQGSQRHSLFDQVGTVDLVITSYALMRRDAEFYRSVEFETVVLDEAQHIKNRQTQNSQAVKAVPARHRFVLTGTPLENSVLDLWSIFDFLMPGYLGAAPEFRERYELPMTQAKCLETQARLARRVNPFLLRRLKREVAQELPEKIEQTAYCELTEDQQTIYRQVLEASRREVLEAVGTQGVAKSRMIVLNALLRLRQICCDLRLLKLENIAPETASGKLDLFQELLDEVLDGGHRVLVFSQFVGMLSLLKERLISRGVEFCYLDGATSNRAEVVHRFQSDGRIPVFLISLKAGGVGLNLTGADTVIHFDPWWNPAVENQATDRAHRIGQTRIVTVYKLLTRGTVEEKILNLQQKKKAIMEGLLRNEEQFAQSLSWEEIQDLLGAGS